MGEGVATPLLEVGVALLAMTLEVVGWTGEGDEVGLEVGVSALEFDELGMPDVFWVVVGAGSLTASTQKLLPDTRPMQSAPTEFSSCKSRVVFCLYIPSGEMHLAQSNCRRGLPDRSWNHRNRSTKSSRTWLLDRKPGSVFSRCVIGYVRSPPTLLYRGQAQRGWSRYCRA